MFAKQNTHTRSITLTSDEIASACSFAKRIEEANARNKRRNKQGLTAKGAESLRLRESGYCGEAALAKALGMATDRIADSWRGGREWVARPDVGIYDVMTTKNERGSLIFTPRDQLLMRKVLVIDCSPDFHICGWYLCEDVRAAREPCATADSGYRNPFWRTERKDGGAWYVPQALLKPISELVRDPDMRRLGPVII